MSDNKLRFFWVDPGCEVKGIPMSVIDAPPDVWIDKVTGARVDPFHRYRFVKCIELPDNKEPDATST